MKYMRLGTRPDTFYTEESTRSIFWDVPTDLIIQVNSTRYLLHKFPILLKCGLLQRLCSSDAGDPDPPTPVNLQGLPGGEEAFELCAKFCYGITIELSARNFMPAMAAARFLQMTESVSRGNFVTKLDTFFQTCIIHGWKDSLITLQSVGKQPAGWPDDCRIVQPCIDAVIEFILTHPSKVTWSFTYTRPGYNQKQHRSAPRDWWTEDVSDLDMDIFRSIISNVRSTKKLPPALIGEALHVYACKHLLDLLEPQGRRPASGHTTPSDQFLAKSRRLLESIVSMIPSDRCCVSGRFVLKLLRAANYVNASPSVKAELVRRSGQQLDEAAPADLLFPVPSRPQSYDVGLVEAILDNFLVQFRRPMQHAQEKDQMVAGAMLRVARILDAYLQVIATDVDLQAAKMIELAESMKEIAREEHDQLYVAIDIYIKEHPELSKDQKKRLCRVIDWRKLSPGARSHAIANDRLPLRAIVQLLFIENVESAGGNSGSRWNDTSLKVSDAMVDTSRPQREQQQQQHQQSQAHAVEKVGTEKSTGISEHAIRIDKVMKIERELKGNYWPGRKVIRPKLPSGDQPQKTQGKQ